MTTPFRTTTHRLKILRSLALKPFQRTRHFYSLLWPEDSENESKQRQARRILFDLSNKDYKNAYVVSVKCHDPFKKFGDLTAIPENVHIICPAGLTLALKENVITPEEASRAIVREDKVNRNTILHNTDNTDNLIVLETWAKQKGFNFSYKFRGNTFEISDPIRKYYTPDATLRFEKSPNSWLSFVLETEDSEPNDYRDKKPGVVWKAIYLLKMLRTEQAKKTFGFSEFRVLFVCKTPEIEQSILKAFRYWMDEPGTFTFWHEESKSYQPITKPSRAFWLTHEKIFRENPGGYIWRTPFDYDTNILYSLNDC